MTKLFSLSDISSDDSNLNQSDAKMVYDPASFINCKNYSKLSELFPGIPVGKSIHYVSMGDWSTHDLVFHLLQLMGPAKIYFTTYSLREYSVRLLLNAINQGMITEVNCILDSRIKSRIPEVYHLAQNNFANVKLMDCHAKVTVLKSDQQTVTIQGSANWTNNPRIESGIVTADQSVGDFHLNWILECMKNGNPFI